MADFRTTYAWEHDPKHLAFSMARYHFVARMLQGFYRVVEVGAGDGVQSRIVAKAVTHLILTDKQDSPLIWNPVEQPLFEPANAIYALDVLEHLDPKEEHRFMSNICKSLIGGGTCIIGMPSLESQAYASPQSREEHKNCKTEGELRELMKSYFRCVYLFGMNDTTLHTGFGPMCHYRIALCNTPIL